MNNIKKIITLILISASLQLSAQIVNIPDANFKARLINEQSVSFDDYDYVFGQSNILFDSDVDTNNDGEIQVSEALAVKSMNLSSENIDSLLGIEAFTNLEYLNVSSNNLMSIDISNNINLEYISVDANNLANIDLGNNINLLHLRAGSNNLETLDFSNNLNIEVIYVRSNQLTGINISNCINLEHLGLYNNSLTTLDISNNYNIIRLDISNNQMASIDVTNNVNLYEIVVDYNQISSLNLDNNINLEYLYCHNNELITLDVSNNFNLILLTCDNNELVSLDISSNNNLISLQYTDNPYLTYLNQKNGNTNNPVYIGNNCPNLQFVCADKGEEAYLNNYFVNNGMNVNVNSYCSFTPGGNYNTITGRALLDIDSNGCDDNDVPFPYMKINIDDGTETGATFINNLAEYSFYTQDGTFTVTPDIENSAFFNATPIDATINFPVIDNSITNQDFCIIANGVHPDVEIVLAPIIPARPGFDAVYLITYKNKGNQTQSGDFSFTYDDTVLDYVSATETPSSQTTGLLTWSYLDLLPFESRSVYVTLNVNSPQETPAVNIDDELPFTVQINPVTGDELPNDNVFDYKQIVVGSYDPNDITCIEGDVVEPSQIGEYLHYIINFENTGNADAQNIVVATEVDPTMFDINSLRVLSSSHDAYVKVTGDIVEIIFESIYLSSGGHGNILLKVQTKQTVQEDDTVTKNANIFFDYNFPIETNNANTTFSESNLSNPDFEADTTVILYPNPVKEVLTISAKNNIKSVSIFDVQGRVIQNSIVNDKEITIDISQRANGVYFVKITTEKGVSVEKIIKD